MKQLTATVSASLLVAAVAACGGGGGGGDDDDGGPAPDAAPDAASDAGPHHAFAMPLLRPPIEAATPPGLLPAPASPSGLLPGPPSSLDPLDVRSRFFSGGPTNMFGILDEVDSRIDFINILSALNYHACVDATPVEYTITPFGQSVTMYAQCFEQGEPATVTDPKLVMWGVHDGVTYILLESGATRMAAISTPIADLPDQAQVHIWYGVGYSNANCGTGAWDACSYGVTEIAADSSTGSFEMAVAGINFGYCGLQYRSSAGTNIYFEGSTGATTDTLCSDGADVTLPGTCVTADLTFTLAPLGTLATTGAIPHAACGYPSAPNIMLDGTTTDDLYFLPTAPLDGVGDFTIPM